METQNKDLDYYRKNAEEDYLTTPISVLRYISEMEAALRQPPVSGALPSIDPLDDEDSEIHKIGREIAEMSDEEFEANCKAISDMLSKSKSKGNGT